MAAPRRLNEPRPVALRAGPDGVPRAVGPVAVEAVREEWLVEDRWWTSRPLRRHYFELAMADGRALTVFRDPEVPPPRSAARHPPGDERRRGGGRWRWYRQQA